MSKTRTPFATGGETHQRADGDIATLTTNHGVPVSDNQNSLKSGARGPTLLEDFVLREKFAMNAFAHLKAIGASDAARPLLDKAGVEPDEGVTGLDGAFVKAAVRRFYDREPGVRMLA